MKLRAVHQGRKLKDVAAELLKREHFKHFVKDGLKLKLLTLTIPIRRCL